MASNVLDELVVSIGLDPSQFIAGRKQFEEQQRLVRDSSVQMGREVEAASLGAAIGVETLARGALKLAAIFTAGLGIKDFVQNVIATGLQIGRMSTMTNISANELGAWRNAAERAGGTAEGVTSSLLGITQGLESFRFTGQSPLIPYFRALGVSLTDANGKLKTAGELTLDLAGSQRLHALDPAAASYLLTQLGFDPGTITLILKGRKALEAALADARKTAPTDADIDAARRFNDQLKGLEQQSTKTGRTILTTLVPALSTTLKFLNDLLALDLTKLEKDWTDLAKPLDAFLHFIGFSKAPTAKPGVDVGGDEAESQLGFHKGAALGVLPGTDEVTKYFIKRGWTPEQAAGIVANLKYESGLKPTQYGDNGQAYGIAQWHADRQAAFARYYGHPIQQSTLAEQLDFVQYELTQGKERAAGTALRAATNLPQAVSTFQTKYERPGNPAQSYAARLRIGEAALRAANLPSASAATGAAAHASAHVAQVAARGATHNASTTNNTSTAHTQIAKIEVLLPNAKTGDDVAYGLASALDRHIFASQANAGQE